MRFPVQDSEVAGLIRSLDWSRTGLGPVSGWPANLKAVVSMMLGADVPMVLLWGAEGAMIYNDAYSGFAGGRHPDQLGKAVRDGWPEVADFNDNVLKVVLGEGRNLAYRDLRLILERYGAPEEVWMNLDYSPVLNDQGQRGGVLAIVKETTDRMRVEERLRIAQEAGGVGTFEWYPETGDLDVSDEYRRIWGLAPDAPISADILVSLLHPEDRGSSGPARLERANPLEYVEYRRVDPVTGEIRWIARRGEVVSSPGVREQRFVGVAIDITERKAAEERLQRSEARWRDLFEQMQEAFFIGQAIRDPDGRMRDFTIVELNPAFEAQTGIKAADAAGQAVSAVIPGIQAELIETYERVVDTGEPAEFEVHIPVLGDRWYEARARRSGPDQFAVLFVDITQRKAVEQAISESEARFRTLAQSMPNHVWTATADGRLDWFNDRVYAYAGAEAGALDGDGWAVMVHPDDLGGVAKAWADARAAGGPYQTEFRLLRHDGAYRWHITRAVPIKSRSGEVERWIGSNTDIADQKAAEEALADLAATLESRVVAEIAERRQAETALHKAQKMETIGKLTGGVAHDFNNLLQVVSGNLQLLARDIAGNERAERRAANALAGVERGARLASQLLAFGRRQVLEPRVMNPGRLLAGMDDMLRRTLGETVEIETIVADDLWNTSIDPGQLENAVLNLAINARDAMDGDGRLTVELINVHLDTVSSAGHDEVPAGDYVMLAVTDTGTGIPSHLIEQVFEPFFSTKPEGKGSGLGLSMVYGFVKQSGGHVKIYSEPGEGVSVKLYLPRVQEDEDVADAAEPGEVVGGAETILVTEDDEQVRETAVEILVDLGYRVLTAPDAASALSVIESGQAIDLLFTDVVMPGPLKSPELARLARERIPGIAVLFTSGYTENAIVHGGRLDAGVDLLGKPYSREALARKVRQVLAKRPRSP